MHPSEGVPPKATLFCPSCGRESRVDGDWTLVDAAGGTRYDCPDCGTVVTRRPSFDDDGSAPLTAWARCWRTWGRALSTWQRTSLRVVAAP